VTYRYIIRPYDVSALDVPVKVQLMNWLTTILLCLTVLVPLVKVGQWMLHHPVFAIEHVEVGGDVFLPQQEDYLPEQIKEWDAQTKKNWVDAHLREVLRGHNFFTLRLDMVRAALETQEWIRKINIARNFPNRLYIHLERNQPVAWWGQGKSSLMVSVQGKVFNNDLTESQGPVLPVAVVSSMPQLIGPSEHSAAEMLQMYQRLIPVLAPLQSPIRQVTLTGHGRWRVGLASGTVLELGRDESPQAIAMMQRLRHLVDTLPQLLSQQAHILDELEYVDLRYASGYALRFRQGKKQYG